VTIVVFTDELLLPAPVFVGSFGSVVPAGARIFAVFVTMPDCGAVPDSVIVTVPVEGSVVTVLVTLFPTTFTVPQTAPPVALPQLAVTPVTVEGTVSL
jgi:hypothetical protein